MKHFALFLLPNQTHPKSTMMLDGTKKFSSKCEKVVENQSQWVSKIKEGDRKFFYPQNAKQLHFKLFFVLSFHKSD